PAVGVDLCNGPKRLPAHRESSRFRAGEHGGARGCTGGCRRQVKKFSRTKNFKEIQKGELPMARKNQNIAIGGTGVIGASWAALYLARGFKVVATDPGPNAEANLRKYIDDAWKELEVIGLSPNASRDNLEFTLDMKKALANADLVQENGPERKDFKIKLFADMDATTPPESIIASSSSGLTMSVIQSACKHPERCVIGHPFNPPHVIPLVEVVAGAKTSAETVQRALAFYRSIGRKAIHV